ncbi:MAG: nickel-dependent hydrogenase large subunit [Gammaproteobacteria bacterium]|nr:nickel-dependent hydrogenase large subunit [Gammaproteobacteria bacterium]
MSEDRKLEGRKIRIRVPVLARVEGEGALDLSIENGMLSELRLEIYEPPRFFEQFLIGNPAQDVIDRVARICGICPVAYQMSAVQALEAIYGVEPSLWAQAMRRVMYCGEWLQSHSLHIHLLAAPDFFGVNSAAELARLDAHAVRRGLRLQGLGNALIALFGGRSVHPVGVRVGGFHSAPSLVDVSAVTERLREARTEADELLRWVASWSLPDDNQDFTSLALRHPGEYPILRGRLVSDAGHDLPIDQFDTHMREFQAPHSTALHALLDDKPYLVGPLARLNLNADCLPDELRALLAEVGLELPSRNMFHSALARAAEIWLAVNEALSILQDYAVPDSPYVEHQPCEGEGVGCTEAPRGVLWHRYTTDANGNVKTARIVPPTSQNQARIEDDLRQSLLRLGLDKPEDELRLHGEKVIRNYDPCISCATHFLRLRVVRS